MGLDVTAFEHAVLLPEHERDDNCYDEHEYAFVIDPDFAQSLRGLEADRCYEVTGEQAHVGNSYSGHNRFREALSRHFLGVEPHVIWDDPDKWRPEPFFELIHFADSEGAIGPDAAADLLADFEAGSVSFRSEYANDLLHAWLVRTYDGWTEVLRVAAGDGLVRFA